MKLLYLYIGHMNRLLEDFEISFTNDYQVHFERNKRKLSIHRAAGEKRLVYGDNISELKILVGKNGCGKSTILNLLGMSSQDLRREFLQYKDERIPTRKNAYDWFVLYHLEGDLFALEGYNPSMVFQTDMYLQNHFSVSFQYDFSTGDLNEITLLQETRCKETKQKYLNKMAYLFYRLEPDAAWYSPIKRQKCETQATIFFDRYDVSQFSYYGIEHFLYLAAKKDADFEKLFDNDPSALKIEVSLNENEINSLMLTRQDEVLAEAIYGPGNSFLSMPVPLVEEKFGTQSELSWKHSMIIRYLEALLVCILKEHPVKNEKTFICEESKEENRYLLRRDFLLDFLKDLTHVSAPEDSYKEYLVNPYDLQLAKQFSAALEQIPDAFFKSGERAEILLRNCRTNFLEQLMQCYDSNQENQEHEINHRGLLAFNVRNLSTGELAMMDLYAAILNGVKLINQMGTHVILLLDEPDSRLHPEWSRLFLKRLFDLLKQEPFSRYQFQIILATHSPLLLSDAAKEDIICLEQTGDGVKVTKTEHGFMSNLNDILLDGMFLSSPFGAFAEEYTDQIIEEISDLKKKAGESSGFMEEDLEQRFDSLQKRIEVIRESYIQKSLKNSLDQLRDLYHSQQPAWKRKKYLEEELRKLKALEDKE